MNNQDIQPIRIGIICPSEIAFRRFLPSVKEVDGIEYVGVAVATPEEWVGDGTEINDTVRNIIAGEHQKAEKFKAEYGGKIFDGYMSMNSSDDIDAVYLPLPPALHKQWAIQALAHGKHVYVEKPFTTSFNDTLEILDLARNNNLAVHENYMFVFHRQIQAVKDIIDSGRLGLVRHYRISFGFPRRAATDFRYNPALGGGALLDAGGYCIKLATLLLGSTAAMAYAHSKYESGFNVDIFGSGIMRNDDGISAEFSFGMDCDYKCELEAWGSKGTLTTGRILTAPDGLSPEMTLKFNQEYIRENLPEDYSFRNSIRHFIDCVNDLSIRQANYLTIRQQSKYLDQFIKLSGHGK